MAQLVVVAMVARAVATGQKLSTIFADHAVPAGVLLRCRRCAMGLQQPASNASTDEWMMSRKGVRAALMHGVRHAR